MTATIDILPVWKKDSTAAEWLQELAAMALVNPEHFVRMIVIHEEVNDEGLPIVSRSHSKDIPSNVDFLGSLEFAKMEVYAEMKGWKR